MQMRTSLGAAVVGALVAFLGAGTANAAFFIIDDSNPNETITISAGDFEFGMTVTGFGSTAGTGDSFTATAAETSTPITFSGSWIDEGLSTPGTFAQIAFDGTLPSDQFVYTVSTDGFAGTISGSFCSDPAVCAIPPGASVTIVGEGPNLFNQAFLSASWVSSAPEPASAPASLVFLGTGLVGLGLARRRSKKSA